MSNHAADRLLAVRQLEERQASHGEVVGTARESTSSLDRVQSRMRQP
jgi:hypothetical protein